MTEAEWLESINPRALVELMLSATFGVRTRWHGEREARRFAVSERKLRLAACACCTKVIDLLPGSAHRRLLVVAERSAGGGAGLDRVDSVLPQAAREWDRFRAECGAGAPELWASGEAREAVCLAACGSVGQLADVFDHVLRAFSPLSGSAIERERAGMADLVREVLGNPFRHEPMEDAWRAADGGTVMRLARAIYDERAYHDLPVLADALLDAGCTSDAILAHCRAGGPHVRGCWALDRVLGLE
jgi:hypothetical protein